MRSGATSQRPDPVLVSGARRWPGAGAVGRSGRCASSWLVGAPPRRQPRAGSSSLAVARRGFRLCSPCLANPHRRRQPFDLLVGRPVQAGHGGCGPEAVVLAGRSRAAAALVERPSTADRSAVERPSGHGFALASGRIMQTGEHVADLGQTARLYGCHSPDPGARPLRYRLPILASGGHVRVTSATHVKCWTYAISPPVDGSEPGGHVGSRWPQNRSAERSLGQVAKSP
jgi:hypothetical protein